MAEVVRVLNEHSIQYAPSPGQQFEVVCKYKYNEDESLIFEIEVPLLSLPLDSSIHESLTTSLFFLIIRFASYPCCL